jgi:hypothetical protein
MKFVIKKIILWPKEPNLKRREINLQPGKVNVIEGHSRTGKSALIYIIDYCLGAGSCRIPIGVIREKTEWFGLLIEMHETAMVVARRNPEENDSTSEMYVDIGKSVEIPEKPFKNDIVDSFKKLMNEITGLPSIGVDRIDDNQGFGSSSFRDMAAFGFQPQYIVANPNALFFKTDTYEHREKLTRIFPLVLGIVTAEELRAEQQLMLLKEEYAKIDRQLEARRQTAESWKSELHGYYTSAREVGLISDVPEGSDSWPVERFVTYLSQAVAEFSRKKVPLLKGDCTAEAVKELVKLKESEEESSRLLRFKRAELRRVEALAAVTTGYGSLVREGLGRLEGIGWFEKKLLVDANCPLCGNKSNLANEELSHLRKLAQDAKRLSEEAVRTPTVLDREIRKLTRECSELEEKLSYIRKRTKVLDDQSVELARQRQQLVGIYRLVGRIEQALESVELLESGGELFERAKKLREKIDNLRRIVDLRKEAALKNDAIKTIGNLIKENATMLNLERVIDEIELSIRDLNLRFKSQTGIKNWLWQLGGGENWMGYHLSTILALHEYFLSLNDCPVPSFLVIDQPTQVYCPSPKSDKGTDEIEEQWQLALKEETDGVRRIFEILSKAVIRCNGRLQILITEHAEQSMWSGLDQIALIEVWRGENDYLIPKDWLRETRRN